MTLEYLLNNVTVQGDIRLSVWENEEEVKVEEFFCCDDLEYEDIDEYRDLEVLYIFTASDHMVHIELKHELD